MTAANDLPRDARGNGAANKVSPLSKRGNRQRDQALIGRMQAHRPTRCSQFRPDVGQRLVHRPGITEADGAPEPFVPDQHKRTACPIVRPAHPSAPFIVSGHTICATLRMARMSGGVTVTAEIFSVPSKKTSRRGHRFSDNNGEHDAHDSGWACRDQALQKSNRPPTPGCSNGRSCVRLHSPAAGHVVGHAAAGPPALRSAPRGKWPRFAMP